MGKFESASQVLSSLPKTSQKSEMSSSLSAEPSAGIKRQMDFNVTAYPSRVNAHLLPDRALKARDFSMIDPLQYRKNHSIRNNNESAAKGCDIPREPGLEMMSTSHLATYVMLLGQELHKTFVPTTKAALPRGYFKDNLAPAFDERSTYRQDYCQEEANGFENAARETLESYRNSWTEEEKANIDIAKKVPYMTLPEAICDSQTTMYRSTMMGDADKEDYRTISQHTNLPDLGTSFAYSAYRFDDPRRKITFDPKITALKYPKSFLEKNSEESGYDPIKAKETHDELKRLRAVRTEQLMKKRENCLRAENELEARKEQVFTCQTTNRKEGYIYLPRSENAKTSFSTI